MKNDHFKVILFRSIAWFRSSWFNKKQIRHGLFTLLFVCLFKIMLTSKLLY